MDTGLEQTEKEKRKKQTAIASRGAGGQEPSHPASQGAGDGRYGQVAIGIGEKLGYGLDKGERVTVTVLRHLVERYSPRLTEKEALQDIEKWKPDPEYSHFPWWDQVESWLDNKVRLKEKDKGN
jgi:hypothetical protein